MLKRRHRKTIKNLKIKGTNRHFTQILFIEKQNISYSQYKLGESWVIFFTISIRFSWEYSSLYFQLVLFQDFGGFFRISYRLLSDFECQKRQIMPWVLWLFISQPVLHSMHKIHKRAPLDSTNATREHSIWLPQYSGKESFQEQFGVITPQTLWMQHDRNFTMTRHPFHTWQPGH